MRRYLILIALAISVLGVSAQTAVEQPDSVAASERNGSNPADSIATHTENVFIIDNVIYSSDSHWDFITKGIALGANSMQGVPADFTGHRNVGWEFFWSDVVAMRYTPWKKGPSFSLGVGIDWDYYYLNEDLRLSRGEDGKSVVCQGFVDKAEDCSSSLQAFSVLVPFSVKYNLSKNWKVEAGIWAMFTTYGSVSSSYTLDGVKYSESWNGVHKRTFRMSYNVHIGYKDIGVYVRYTPKNAIKSGYGPQFKAISAGIILGF